MAKRKLWTKTITEHGIAIRLFERQAGGTIYRDVGVGRVASETGKARTAHDVKSLKHSDRDRAEEQAKALATKLAEARLIGVGDGRLTLGQLFAAYRRYKLDALRPSWAKAAETRIDLFLRAWGNDLRVADIDQSRVDAFAKARRNGALVPKRLQEPEEGKRPGRGYRKPRPVRDGTLDADFRWLSSVLNFGGRHRHEGRRLLSENPLHDVVWPREKNPRRPVASHQRYLGTIGRADEVDPAGRLRAVLALARWTGRRESAICKLRASDLLLSDERIRAALASEGMDERLADHMPHGAIRWAAEADKLGLLFVTPINQEARAELDRYLRRAARLGDVPLFPAPGAKRKKGAPPPQPAPEKPIGKRLASRWLVSAEELARLPKIQQGVFHPYRRLWASERKHHPDVDVAASGGWRDTRALKLSYQQADPETVLKVVEGRS